MILAVYKCHNLKLLKKEECLEAISLKLFPSFAFQMKKAWMQ